MIGWFLAFWLAFALILTLSVWAWQWAGRQRPPP